MTAPDILIMRFKDRKPYLVFIITGIAFIVGGIDCLENDLKLLAISSFIVGIINIASCIFIKTRPFFLKIFSLFVNSVFAFISSYTYVKAGMDKIQYAWALIGIISLFFMVYAMVKRKKVIN